MPALHKEAPPYKGQQQANATPALVPAASKKQYSTAPPVIAQKTSDSVWNDGLPKLINSLAKQYSTVQGSTIQHSTALGTPNNSCSRRPRSNIFRRLVTSRHCSNTTNGGTTWAEPKRQILLLLT